MIAKARRGAVCLFLSVGFLLALPQNPRSPLNFSDSALKTRAVHKNPGFDLSKLETGAACTGDPDFSKDTAPGVSSNPDPAPSDHLPALQPDRKKEILSLIHYPWEELGFNISFMGPRLGYRAMTLTGRRRIEVYLRSGESASQQAFDLAHELGHAFDLKYNDDARRQKWRELRGIKKSTPWFGCDACPDYATPAGDFAETFAFLLLGPGNFHSMISPLPAVEKILELAAFCHIDHLSGVLEAELKKQDRSEKIQTARSESSRRSQVAKEKTTETAASMSKSAQTTDSSEKIQVENRPEENLSDFESPQTEALVRLHSPDGLLFDVNLPDDGQQLMIPAILPSSK